MQTIQDFSQFNISPSLLQGLEVMGFKQPRPIQQAVLSDVLAGHDMIVKAATGSGKTVAFGLSLLQQTETRNFQVQSLVLCPTRELAMQVAAEIRKLGRFCHNLKVVTVCGGSPIGLQIASLEHGAHCIVATPGRILDLLRRRLLSLRMVHSLVLDEADRMLEMGFEEDIAAIIGFVPTARQTLLFSATFPPDIQRLSSWLQKNPKSVALDATTATPPDIQQLFLETPKDAQFDQLLKTIHAYRAPSTLVFCTTKRQCDDVASFLTDQGMVALSLHSDLEQRDREDVLLRFSNRSVSILVATDVAARGLDIQDLGLVINFELSRDPEVHVHRIGRTGRSGKKGVAVSFYNRSEEFRLKAIEAQMGIPLARLGSLPSLVGASRARSIEPTMSTLKIFGGKKDKLRPGDILGALTQSAGLEGAEIGKIDVLAQCSYVAITRSRATHAYQTLGAGKIKNRKFGIKLL